MTADRLAQLVECRCHSGFGPLSPNPLADLDPPGPNPLADLEPPGPYPLADLDRGGPILGGSKSARTPDHRGFTKVVGSNSGPPKTQGL